MPKGGILYGQIRVGLKKSRVKRQNKVVQFYSKLVVSGSIYGNIIIKSN